MIVALGLPIVASAEGPRPAAITIRPEKTFQTWIAWNAWTRRWDAPSLVHGAGTGSPLDHVPRAAREKILDILYGELKLDGVGVILRGGPMDPAYPKPTGNWRSHDPKNNGALLDFAYWGPHVRLVKAAFERIRARKEKPVLVLRVDGGEEWMRGRGAGIRPGAGESFAEWVRALLSHLHGEGVPVDYVSVGDGLAGAVEPGILADALLRLETRSRAVKLDARVATRDMRGMIDARSDSPEQALGAANAIIARIGEGATMLSMPWAFGAASAFVLLSFDADNEFAFEDYKPSVYVSVLGEFTKHIRPGMKRVEAVSADPDVRAVAFRAPGAREAVAVVVNNSDEPRAALLSRKSAGVVAPRSVRAFYVRLE